MLPSGRHVAIDTEPLVRLQRDAAAMPDLEPFMRIRHIEDLYPYVEVVLFRPRRGLHGAPGGADATGAGLVPCHSGYSLATAELLTATWPQADRAAFAAFIAGTQCRAWLAENLDLIRAEQRRLIDEAPHRVRGLAIHWPPPDPVPAESPGGVPALLAAAAAIYRDGEGALARRFPHAAAAIAAVRGYVAELVDADDRWWVLLHARVPGGVTGHAAALAAEIAHAPEADQLGRDLPALLRPLAAVAADPGFGDAAPELTAVLRDLGERAD
jgi:hypothetical protein